MMTTLENLSQFIGNTPLRKLRAFKGNLYVKLEYNNYSGSIKDRAAYNIIYQGIMQGRIDRETEIVESSSGNFAIALASICQQIGLRFTPVIDPNINPGYEKLLKLLTPNVVKVTEVDVTGGYLLTRIEEVKRIRAMRSNVFWTNQYENPDNFMAYYNGLGKEICDSFSSLDYMFIGVSSGGTITGLSKRLKEHFPAIKIIAVDVEGSVIFGQKPKKRHLSGIGASKKPAILSEAQIDHIMHISEPDIIKGCYELLCTETIFGGSSAGASYSAVLNYFATEDAGDKNILFLCPDRGTAYLDTVYNTDWTTEVVFKAESERQLHSVR